MNPNLHSVTREKRELQMMRSLMPNSLATMTKIALTLLCCTLLMLAAAPARADQCQGALPITNPTNSHPVTGCGVLITVFAVDINGNATAFNVSTPNNGNNNPYDGIEDTLVGIQNSSGPTAAALKSITLTSSDPIFGFDNDGPCHFNGNPCNADPADYQGPINTFSNFSTLTTGTVTFTPPISNGGGTWFALEGGPTSFGTISQTQTLEPGVQSIYPAGNDNSKWTPFNNKGGESLTVTAVPFPQMALGTLSVPFQHELCVPYKDFTDANSGVHTCVGFQTQCVDTATSNDCSTFLYQVITSYDLPDDLVSNGVPQIGGLDFLVFHGQQCPPTDLTKAQSIFLSYTVNRVDPTHSGGGGGTSCYIAMYTPGAPAITSGTFSTFIGFQSPVSNTALNVAKAGSTVPLKWVQLDNLGNPVTNLSLCTTFTPASPPASLVPACTVPAGVSTPWVNVQAYSVPGALCTADVTVGTDTLPTNFAGNSGLQNQSNIQPGLYQYNWKTPSGIPKGTCAEIIFTYSSGTSFVTPPEFQFK
jgi:hypothetical protein